MKEHVNYGCYNDRKAGGTQRTIRFSPSDRIKPTAKKKTERSGNPTTDLEFLTIKGEKRGKKKAQRTEQKNGAANSRFGLS